MSKAMRSTTTQQRTLSDVVSISRQFLRSVRIDTDLGREDALSGYICQGTARSLLENMSKQIVETNQRAFTWTGPYGGGKSSLALSLCSLVSPNPKIRAKARQVLGLSEGSLVQRAFATKSDGWLVVPVVGKRADVRTELSNALAEARGVSPSRRKNLDVVAELVDEAERHPNGVLVIIDELDKHAPMPGKHANTIDLGRDRQGQFSLVTEMVEEGALGDPRLPDDVIHGDGVDRPTRQQDLARPDQGLPRPSSPRILWSRGPRHALPS